MAEGLLRHSGGRFYEVSSVSTKPTPLRHEATTVMREVGVDTSAHRSKAMEEFSSQDFDYVTTVYDNAKESCPIFPAKTQRIHWSIEDTAGIEGAEQQRLDAFRRARDALQR